MPEPGTLLIVGGGALALWKAFSKGDEGTPPPGPPPTQCNNERMQQTILAAAQTGVLGAQTGAPAGGAGAGIGAGVGAGLATLPGLIECGPDKISAAFKDVCAKAVAAKRQLQEQGVPIPAEWNHWSCEQRLAFMAAFPGILPSLLAGHLVGQWATKGADLFKAGFSSAEAAVARAGGHISNESRKAVNKALDNITSGAQHAADQLNPFKGIGCSSDERFGCPPERANVTTLMAFDGAAFYGNTPVGSLGGVSLSSPGGNMHRQDVDFGFLGRAPGHRGGFNGFGAATPVSNTFYGNWGQQQPMQEVSTGGTPRGSAFDLNKALDTGAGLLNNLFGRPQESSGAGGTTVVVSGGTPAWVLPAAGLLVVGGLAYILLKKR